jgi:hypothetical protein
MWSKLHSNKNQSSLARSSGLSDSWCLISLRRSALCVDIRTPVVRSWTSMHRYIHCVCVTCRSCVIRPAIHRVVRYDLPAVWKCALWMGRSLCEIIPMTKLSHPMISCDDAYSCRIGGRSKLLAHSRHVVEPRPRKYFRSNTFMLECVSTVSIHFWTAFADS